MRNNRHRVVVQLTDIEGEDFEREMLPFHEPLPISAAKRSLAPTSSRTEQPISAQVEVLDDRTLMLSLQKEPNKVRNFRPMHFDCVGSRSDARTRAQIAEIVDQMLMNCNNCCLLKFIHAKETHMPFICTLLVSEIDKRLQMMRGTIHTIKLEYFDIQKYDVINLLHEESKKKRRKKLRNQFSNTLELHKWFQSEYGHMWAASVGHDCLDLQIVFVDSSHRLHKVKFSFFTMYLNKMDNDSRAQVRNFFENLGTEKRFKHSLLTDCLKEYFRGHDEWRSWVIFDIPVMRNTGGKVVDDMLKLANAAYVGVHEEIKPVDINSIDSDILLDESPVSSKRRLGTSNYEDTFSLANVTPGEPFLKKTGKVKKDKYLTGNDFNSLSFWYCKMDERYLQAIAAMEAYYNAKYDIKITKLCGDIKQMVRTIDHSHHKTSESFITSSGSFSSEHELQACYNSYKSALLAFRNMAKEIERSNYGALLKIYLKTKSYELAQNALRFKVKQLENCQTRLSGTISEEVKTLNSMKIMFVHKRVLAK